MTLGVKAGDCFGTATSTGVIPFNRSRVIVMLSFIKLNAGNQASRNFVPVLYFLPHITKAMGNEICVAVQFKLTHTHTHTHSSIHTFIYVHIHMCVCVM